MDGVENACCTGISASKCNIYGRGIEQGGGSGGGGSASLVIFCVIFFWGGGALCPLDLPKNFLFSPIAFYDKNDKYKRII